MGNAGRFTSAHEAYEKFENAAKKLWQSLDLSRDNDGSYNNHLTYQLLMAYASGYADGLHKDVSQRLQAEVAALNGR